MSGTNLSPKILGKTKGYRGEFCSIPGCSNARGKCLRLGKKLSFYTFPREEKRRDAWLKVIRRDTIVIEDGIEKVVPFVPNKYSRVCSEHFVDGVKVDIPGLQDYVPSVFPRNKTAARGTKRSKLAGFVSPPPTETKSRKRRSDNTELSDVAGRPKRPRKLDYFSGNCDKAVWNTTDHDYVNPLTNCAQPDDDNDKNIEDLRHENSLLRSKLLRIENIKDDDVKFQFYTNLPNYKVFTALSDYLKTRTNGNMCYWRGETTNFEGKAQSKGPDRKLSFEEEFFIVLVKLKTGNFNEDLSHIFDISKGQVSRLFSTWVNFLSNELRILFEMQESDSSQMAECYEAFENLRIVLDCTELMIQRASNLDARKKTFSNYKHHDTVKFLVGISPSLAVNYVSRAWGGRASDKHITMNSEELIGQLNQGDSVMVDRGFTIGSDLKKMGVELLMPEFKGRNRAQFTSQEAARSEYISKARIHIERVIQRIKTFHFLERVIRLNMQDIVEQIFLVCAYLTNFQLPVIRRK